MSTSGIEWTDATWNPVVGCTPVSPGCLNCYAATMGVRLEAMGRPEYVGLTVKKNGRAVFTGKVNTLEDRLAEPLSWRKPRRVFVNSMSDLFHEDVPFEFIAAVFGICAATPLHTYQVLTKRPERAVEFFAWMQSENVGGAMTPQRKMILAIHHAIGGRAPGMAKVDGAAWPLPNVWLGTSVEDQARADERIPHLLKCPAAVRFLSCEPLLSPVRLRTGIYLDCDGVPRGTSLDQIHWVIVGGESGAHARPCDVANIRSIVAQCKGAGVPVFVKQLGANIDDSDTATGWFRCPKCRGLRDDYDVLGLDAGTCQCHACGEIVKIDDNLQKYDENGGIKLRDRKGGNPAEWPEDLRVREFPGGVAGAASPCAGGVGSTEQCT